MRPCTQCGKCCLKYSAIGGLGSATDDDMERWAEKPNILRYVDVDLWISPRTGEDMERCPWLRKKRNQDKFNCTIHDCRPDVCRGYPCDIDQMIRDECEMLEPGDADRPLKQLRVELRQLRNTSA